ncbi:MAG: hypothetical protein JW876_06585, partial [Candidatus Krumholzibacteriota bacterium]|nr:hypothetical protein [Candidatus Krumholzibacteriota bacterium]
MLRIPSFFRFMESNFDYLLVFDEQEKILHASPLLERDVNPGGAPLEGRGIGEILTPASLDTVRSAMAQARGGHRGIAVISPAGESAVSIPLKAGMTEGEAGIDFVFFGKRLEGLHADAEWEKNERVKELSCLYDVAEFIDVSSSIHEFFTRLPEFLSPGMLFPDETVVYSAYQGTEYGQKPSSGNYISVRLVVGGQDKGEIRVGYHDDDHELLPEEQKMLDEIARILNLALERKELKERLVLKQEEEAEYSRRLEELTSEIASKTIELDGQRRKLEIVDSYINRVNRGWEESKVQLETMFKAIPDEVVLIDRNRRVVMTNREDVTPGVTCYEGFFGRDKPCENCRLARILSEKTPLTLTMKHEDRFLQVHALPVVYSEEGEVDGILEFYRDVTLEHTYDQQLQQADKLASLGQLVSGIGHEINNPNQFIRGNIKIIKQALDDMLPIVDDYQRTHPELKIARLQYGFFREHIMTLVDDMAHGSERIKAIVEGLRTFVRKDEGLLVDTVDINTLVEASARLVHNQVHQKAEIELDLGADIPTFTGNAQKIEQVLVNLLVN